MNTAAIRQQLHHFIDTVEDKKAMAIYTIFENEMDTDARRVELIQAERGKYLNGEGHSFTPAEVREMALNKKKRNVL